MQSLQGQLLLASPDLRDPNFFHTVVLMVRHNDEGALGLVLNRPLTVRLAEVWGQAAGGTPARNDLIYLGGPCEGPLMALHDDATIGESEVLPGLHFCTTRDALEQLAADADRQARFFAGFAGWSAGQLEGELAEGSWKTAPAAPTQVFDPDPELWERLAREISGREMIDALHIRHVPPDVRMN